MVGFSRLLSRQEIADVVDFVREEFIVNKSRDTRYHSKVNGWEDHDRYAIAYPFATGAIALDQPWEDLTQIQQQGKRFYLKYCITCHDRSRVQDEGEYWSTQTFSYPRNSYDHKNPTQHYDGVSSASVYAYHDQQPNILLHSPYQRMGRDLYQKNCAFCHAADGSGRNWIGSFLEPKPRDFNQPEFMSQAGTDFLLRRIKRGIPNTSMPAWESVLSESQIESIISYMRIAFHPPEREIDAHFFLKYESISHKDSQ
jgi:cytochrome c oxidase cbb3-type subunit 3